MDKQQNILETKNTSLMRELIKSQIVYLKLCLKTYVFMSTDQTKGYEKAIADLEELLQKDNES